MSSSVFPVHNTRKTWLIYTCVLVALSSLCFGSLRNHLIDTHDDQTFRDNIALSQDFAYFFAPLEEKQLGSGRPAAELIKCHDLHAHSLDFKRTKVRSNILRSRKAYLLGGVLGQKRFDLVGSAASRLKINIVDIHRDSLQAKAQTAGNCPVHVSTIEAFNDLG